MALYGDKPIRKYPALVGHAPPEVESAIRESYDMIYQQQATIDSLKSQLAEALRKSNPVVIRQSLQANGSTPLAARMLVGGSNLLENPVRVGPIRDPLNPPKLVFDFGGFELGGTNRPNEEIYFKRSTLGVNRIELAMAKNNGVLTITGNRVVEASEFGATDPRIGECMGAGISLFGEDNADGAGQMHLVYGGATASSSGETSGRTYMSQMRSDGFRYPFFCDENARFGFRDWTSHPVCFVVCAAGGSGTLCIDNRTRNLTTLNGIDDSGSYLHYVLHNMTDGSYAVVTSVDNSAGTNDALTCSGGLSGGSDNTFSAGDLVAVYARYIAGYDFTAAYSKLLCWSLGHTSANDTVLTVGANNASRGVVQIGSDDAGNRAGQLVLYGENGNDSWVFRDSNGNLRHHTADPDTDDTLGDQFLCMNAGYNVSTGVGSILTWDGSARDNEGWIRIKSGSGYIRVPYWLDS